MKFLIFVRPATFSGRVPDMDWNQTLGVSLFETAEKHQLGSIGLVCASDPLLMKCADQIRCAAQLTGMEISDLLNYTHDPFLMEEAMSMIEDRLGRHDSLALVMDSSLFASIASRVVNELLSTYDWDFFLQEGQLLVFCEGLGSYKVEATPPPLLRLIS